MFQTGSPPTKVCWLGFNFHMDFDCSVFPCIFLGFPYFSICTGRHCVSGQHQLLCLTIQMPKHCRLLGQWPEVLQYHRARKLRMKPAAFPLPSPLTTSRRCPGSRTCHSAVEDGNISVLVLVINLS